MRRRILLLSPFAPACGGMHGSAKVIHGLGLALADRHDLMLIHLDDGDIDPEFERRCVAVERLVPHTNLRHRRRSLLALLRGRPQWVGQIDLSALRSRVRELSASFAPDVVQIEHPILADAFLDAPPKAVRVVTIYDPAASWRQFTRLHDTRARLLHRVDAAATVRQERRALALADGAVAFTEPDRRTILDAAGASDLVVERIALGWDVPDRPLDPVGAAPPVVLFIGNFRHPPNRDAATHLVGSIFPRVLATCPDARLEIVGADPPDDLRARSGGPISVTGRVTDVGPFLDRAAVVVAPLRLGGGVRIKVIEALAAGKAVVASPLALHGISANDGAQVVRAAGDVATADALIGLLVDPARRRRLARAARAWAEADLSWPEMSAAYERLYAGLRARVARRTASHPAT